MDEMPQTISKIGFLLAVAFLVVACLIGLYDLYALWYLPREATVSWQLRSWCQAVPILPVAIGIVLGHLFFPLPR